MTYVIWLIDEICDDDNGGEVAYAVDWYATRQDAVDQATRLNAELAAYRAHAEAARKAMPLLAKVDLMRPAYSPQAIWFTPNRYEVRELVRMIN